MTQTTTSGLVGGFFPYPPGVVGPYSLSRPYFNAESVQKLLLLFSEYVYYAVFSVVKVWLKLVIFASYL
jgi:hypothetical protein